jgi:signal transduction histidine kinase
VGIDAADVSRAVRDFGADLVPFLLVIGGILLAANWAQVTVGLRPLAAVRQRLAAIRSGDAQGLGLGFPDEVKPLAAEIDGLLDAREQQIQRARARAADLAHGLRTPLQILAADAERLQAKGEGEIAAEVKTLVTTMHRHIERELARARLAADKAQARANVRDVAERVIDVVRRAPNAQHLSWSVDIPRNLVAPIDADDLAEALGDLVENAARHAQSRVGVEGGTERDAAFVAVTDDGPGIPAERLPEALKRGGHLDGSGSGAGGGLASGSDISEAWGAVFSIEEKAGVKASLRFRRA